LVTEEFLKAGIEDSFQINHFCKPQQLQEKKVDVIGEAASSLKEKKRQLKDLLFAT